MIKKTFFNIVSCLLASVLLIIILYSLTNKQNNKKNGFARLLKADVITKIKSYKLNYNSFYIAGLATNEIYLGNYVATSRILVFNYNLNKIHDLQIKNSDTNKVAWKKVMVSVDSPNIYLMEGVSPSIFYSTLSSLKAESEKLDGIYFSASVPLSRRSFIIKAYDNDPKQFRLAKVISDSVYLEFATSNLEKQVDGIFCVDGMLLHETKSSKVIYVYFYRNQILCLDTNLNLIYKSQTIDTIKRVQITVGNFASQSKITLSSPPLNVNKHASLTDKWILVHSALIADNESKEVFNKSSVIDVYAIENGKYLFSFYLPNDNNERITSFKVNNNNILVALTDHFITTYKLHFNPNLGH